MCCVTLQQPKHLKLANFNRNNPFYSDFLAFFAIFEAKASTVFSFKKCVRIKSSIVDKSQPGNNNPEKEFTRNQKRLSSI